MLMKQDSARKVRGFTLTEAAIVLGIVGLILGAIWVAAAAVYNNLRVSTSSNQLLQIVQSVRSMHATQTTIDTAITAMLVAQAGGIPSDMITKDAAGAVTAVRDVWAGNVTIDDSTFTIPADSFSVTFEDVPYQACADLLLRNTGSGRDSGLVAAGAGGPVSANANTNFPMTLTDVTTACGTSGTTSVSFAFRLKS